MTQDEIILLAREVWGERAVLPFNDLERFAALVAAHEREKQAKQKPIGYVIEDNDYEGSKIRAEPINGCCLPVYLAPVRTKDLTDDEIAQAVGSPLDEVYLADFRAVIAADREKNKCQH